VAEKLIARNPFIGWRVKVLRKTKTRETKAFTNDEIATILTAALAIQPRTKGEAARRCCPWLALTAVRAWVTDPIAWRGCHRT
jgi:hypothetical protein